MTNARSERWRLLSSCTFLALALSLVACSTNTNAPSFAGAGGLSNAGGSAGRASTGGTDSGIAGATATGGSAGFAADSGVGGTAGQAGSSGEAGPPPVDTLTANRNRLLKTYFDFLKANPTVTQSNGLSGNGVASICDLWQQLAPSAQGVFLTLTARMQGSILGIDGRSMLSHVTKLYRIAGGKDASPTSAGSCGGSEYNRMIMSMDATLHDAQLAANKDKGAKQPNGKYDISDIPVTSFWRNSHDLGGPHAPFDISDETNQGAPRGQTQYFSDPTSTLANSPLGRMDLTTLIDPYALEMDQDYDCVHNSNPLCTYTTYGPLCQLRPALLGIQIYQQNYGSADERFSPSCN